MVRLRTAFLLAASAWLVAGCVGESAEPECTRAIDCPGGDCVNGVCEMPMTAADVTTTTTTDGGSDATSEDVPDDTSTTTAADTTTSSDVDATTATDAGGDTAQPTDTTGADMGDTVDPIVFPDPAAPQAFELPIPVLVRGVAPLGNGSIVAGATTADFEAGESREAVAVHYEGETVRWAARIGDTSSDQFTGVTTDNGKPVLVGASRGYSVTAANNSDVLIVTADENGFGDAYNFGTPDDEVAYAITPGGSLATWIVVGERRVGDEGRDFFVAAFDDVPSPRWAYAIDIGNDDFATAVTVVDGVAYIAGASNIPNDPGRNRSAMVAVDESGVLWGRLGAEGSRTMSVHPAADGVRVGGRVPRNGGLRAAWMLFDRDGRVSGDVFEIAGGSIAGRIEDGEYEVLIGQNGDLSPFILSQPGGSRWRMAPLDTALVPAGFLPMPVSSGADGAYTALTGPRNSVVHVPFTAEPRAACGGASAEIAMAVDITADDFEELALDAVALDFGGGLIADPRRTSLMTTSSASACAP